MYDKIGGDIDALANSSGSVVDENGETLIGTDTAGPSSYVLGPTMLRAIIGGVANGDFAKPPLEAETAISDSENPMPYWSWVDSSSSGRITAAFVADADSASGNVLRFTAVNALSGDKAYIERNISVLGSQARTLTYQPRSVWTAATSSGTYKVFTEAQFLQNDGTTTTGTSAAGTATGSTVATAGVREVQANPNGNGAVPTDGAFIRLRVGMEFTSNRSGTTTVDCCEIRMDYGGPQVLLTDNTDPASYGYGVVYLNNGVMWIRANETGSSGSNPSINMSASSGNIAIDASLGSPSTGNISLNTKSGGTVTTSNNLTVTDLLTAGNIKSGRVTVSVTANVVSSASVTNLGLKTSAATADDTDVSIQATQQSTRPDLLQAATVSSTTFSGSTCTGFTIYIYRTNSTDTSVFWLAHGR